jgi:hypothetical protein
MSADHPATKYLPEYEASTPGPFRLSNAERSAFKAGWDRAMKFMAEPRIPVPPAPEKHNPDGLASFYTDR